MKKQIRITFAEWVTPEHVKCIVEHFHCVVKKRLYQTYNIEAPSMQHAFEFGRHVDNVGFILTLYMNRNKSKNEKQASDNT